jgi:hypothetical protein
MRSLLKEDYSVLQQVQEARQSTLREAYKLCHFSYVGQDNNNHYYLHKSRRDLTGTNKNNLLGFSA